MRLLWTIGRMVLLDLTLFAIHDEDTDPDVVVVHHYNTEDDDEEDREGPPDIFGKG